MKSIELLKKNGVDARYLCHLVNPQTFNKICTNKQYDVVFVGNWSPWRDEVIQATLETTSNIALYGPYWQRKSKISKIRLNEIYKGNKIVGEDLNSLFNKAHIVLNASRFPGSSGLNMRFFEVPATGTLLLTDAVPEICRHFNTETDLVVYKDTVELTTILNQLLTNKEKIISFANQGQSKVLSQYTYANIATFLLAEFEQLIKN